MRGPGQAIQSRGRAGPGPGLVSPPVPPTPVCPLSCEGREEGRPGCGVGRWVGVRAGGSWSVGPEARHPVSSPSWWPAGAVGVAVPPWCRAHSAPSAACRRGCGGVRCHPSAAGRIAIVRLVVEGRLTTGRALPYRGRAVVAARGSVPRWWAWAGIGLAVGPSPARIAEVPAVRALLPSRRAMRGGRHRARSARPVAKCVWARCRGRSPPLTPRRAGSPGVPPRRRGGRRRGHDPRPL